MQHHARLSRTSSFETSLEPVVDEGIELVRLTIEKFGIDDARSLIHSAHLRPESAVTTRQFFVVTQFITEEAQHALLKLLEEPPATATFHFVLPVGFRLLPTLESRFSKEVSEDTLSNSRTYEDFEQAGYADRLTLIEQKLNEKDMVWLHGVREGLRARLELRDTSHDRHDVETLSWILARLGTRGASNKMLLEELALRIPSRS